MELYTGALGLGERHLAVIAQCQSVLDPQRKCQKGLFMTARKVDDRRCGREVLLYNLIERQIKTHMRIFVPDVMLAGHLTENKSFDILGNLRQA